MCGSWQRATHGCVALTLVPCLPSDAAPPALETANQILTCIREVQVLLDAMDAMFLMYAVDRDHRTMMPRGDELHDFLSQQQVGRPLSGVKVCVVVRFASVRVVLARQGPVDMHRWVISRHRSRCKHHMHTYTRLRAYAQYTPRGWTYVPSAPQTQRTSARDSKAANSHRDPYGSVGAIHIDK